MRRKKDELDEIIEKETKKVDSITYEDLQDASKKIQEKYSDKKILLQRLKDYEDPSTYISSGIQDFDRMLGGKGLLAGRIVQIFGKDKTGKTSLATLLASKFPVAIYIDCETTFMKKRANEIGLSDDRSIIARPETGEIAIDIIKEYTKKSKIEGEMCIVVDSVGAMKPKKLLDMDEKDETADKKPGVALTAALLSTHINHIAYLAAEHGVTIIFINQLRDKVGGFIPFGDNTYTPGGWALKYALTTNIRLSRKATLKINQTPLGIRILAKLEAHKVSNPFEACEMDLIFDIAKFISIEDEKKELKEANKRYKEYQKTLLAQYGVENIINENNDDEISFQAIEDEDE